MGIIDKTSVTAAAADETVFKPTMPEEKRARLLDGWEEAVQRAKRK